MSVHFLWDDDVSPLMCIVGEHLVIHLVYFPYTTQIHILILVWILEGHFIPPQYPLDDVELGFWYSILDFVVG